MLHAVGIIADIVGSRELADRSAAQQAILAAFGTAEQDIAPLRSAWATVGDEFQVIARTWPDALRLTLRVQLVLPDDVRLRFGLGLGEIHTIDQGDTGPIQDGTAWLHARTAIDHIAEHQQRRDDALTSFQADDLSLTAAVNGQLLLRDHVVARMKARERRLCAALLAGATQQEAARTEKISQAAVSQALHRSGAMALLDADAVFEAASSRALEEAS